MEKKGEIINQLAIIVDLIEKVNIDFISSGLEFNVNEKEFTRIYNYTSRKNGEAFVDLDKDTTDFYITISDVIIKINKSNV
jgi:hypothetical protein